MPTAHQTNIVTRYSNSRMNKYDRSDRVSARIDHSPRDHTRFQLRECARLILKAGCSLEKMAVARSSAADYHAV